jgi:hypothetical protein
MRYRKLFILSNSPEKNINKLISGASTIFAIENYLILEMAIHGFSVDLSQKGISTFFL